MWKMSFTFFKWISNLSNQVRIDGNYSWHQPNQTGGNQFTWFGHGRLPLPVSALSSLAASCHLPVDQLWHLSYHQVRLSSQDFGLIWQNICIEVKRYMGTGLCEMSVLRHLQAKQRTVTSSPRILPSTLSPLLMWTTEGHHYSTNATNWTGSSKHFRPQLFLYSSLKMSTLPFVNVNSKGWRDSDL